jgi:DNA-binding FrmR family transcriptional regulator
MVGHPHTHTKKVTDRLARIAGHVQGIKTMVEEGKACEDVLVQLSAVQSAVKNVSRIILVDHLEHCIIDAVKDGNEKEALEKLGEALKKFQ